MGVPAIVTGWSGTADVVTQDVGWLIDYTLVPVGDRGENTPHSILFTPHLTLTRRPLSARSPIPRRAVRGCGGSGGPSGLRLMRGI